MTSPTSAMRLLTLYEATGRAAIFQLRRSSSATASSTQHRDADGNYFDTAGDSEPLIVRPAHHRRQPGERRAVGCGGAVLPDARVHRRGAVARLRAWRSSPRSPPWSRARRSPSRGSRPRWSWRSGRCARSRSPATPATHEPARSLEVAHRRFDPMHGARLGTVRRRARSSTAARRWTAIPAAYVCRGFVCQAPVTAASDARARARGSRLTGQN